MLRKHIESNHEIRLTMNSSTEQSPIMINDTDNYEYNDRALENVGNSSNSIKCLQCDEMFLGEINLQKHFSTNHRQSSQPDPTACKAALSQDLQDIDVNKVKAPCEIESLKNKINELNEQNDIMKRQENKMLLKIKEVENQSKANDKTHKKNIKHLESKIVLLGNTIKNYVIELDKQVQLKEKYAEEKKTLTNIIENHIALKDLKIDLQNILSVEKDDKPIANEELTTTSEDEWEDVEPEGTDENGFEKVIRKRKKRLAKQRKSVHTNKPMDDSKPCTYCGEKFDNRSELTTHEANQTSKPTFECEDCKQKFTKEKDLKEHIDASHKSVIPIKCRICNFHTARQVDFLLHMECHNSNNPKNNVNSRRQVCTWFLRGKCRFGNSCWNLHSAPPQCIFKSKCRAWPQCKFSHYEVCKENQECFNQNCNLEHPSKPFLGSNCTQKTPNITSHLDFPPLKRGSRLY